LYTQHRALAGRILETFPNEREPVKKWIQDNAEEVERISHMLADMQGLATIDYAIASVAVSSFDQLLRVTESS
jgi:NAD-specific glutamate dehydrogenase